MTDKITMIKDLDKVMQDVDKVLANDLCSRGRGKQNQLVTHVIEQMYGSARNIGGMVELLGICNREQATACGRKFSTFVTTTPYRYIACRLLEMLTSYETSWAISCDYQPAQDYLAELSFLAPLKHPNSEEEIKNRLRALRKFERHLRDGYKRGLTIEEITTHDEIYGYFIDKFDDSILDVAKRISSYMHQVMPKYAEGYDWEYSMYEQSEEVRRNVNTGLRQVADFIRNIRDKEFAEGWLNDDSLAFGYLMSHAERIVYDTALSNDKKSEK